MAQGQEWWRKIVAQDKEKTSMPPPPTLVKTDIYTDEQLFQGYFQSLLEHQEELPPELCKTVVGYIVPVFEFTSRQWYLMWTKGYNNAARYSPLVTPEPLYFVVQFQCNHGIELPTNIWMRNTRSYDGSGFVVQTYLNGSLLRYFGDIYKPEYGPPVNDVPSFIGWTSPPEMSPVFKFHSLICNECDLAIEREEYARRNRGNKKRADKDHDDDDDDDDEGEYDGIEPRRVRSSSRRRRGRSTSPVAPIVYPRVPLPPVPLPVYPGGYYGSRCGGASGARG